MRRARQEEVQAAVGALAEAGEAAQALHRQLEQQALEQLVLQEDIRCAEPRSTFALEACLLCGGSRAAVPHDPLFLAASIAGGGCAMLFLALRMACECSEFGDPECHVMET